VVKVRGDQGGRASWSGLSPLLLMEKCSIMHKMCQIPHPHRRLRPLSPLLDLATLTTVKSEISALVESLFTSIVHIVWELAHQSSLKIGL